MLNASCAAMVLSVGLMLSCGCSGRTHAEATIGMERAAVLELLGPPVREFSEIGFQGRVQVLLYPSDRDEPDGNFPGAREYIYYKLKDGVVFVHGYFVDRR